MPIGKQSLFLNFLVRGYMPQMLHQYVRVTETLALQKIFTTPAGWTVLDFGQNMVGKLLIHSMTLPLNATVSFTHAEVMEDDGELGTRPLRGAQCVDTVISSGPPLVDWSPKFTFHGFRFVQVDGWDPRTEQSWQTNIQALVIHTDFKRTGRFECSNMAVNQLHQNACWSMRGNFLSIPTDCPQRGERLGWTGDIQVFGPSATFLYDSNGMLSESMEDVAYEQSDNDGVPPLVVPNILDHVWPSIPQALWDDVVIILPWVLYYGNWGTGSIPRRHPMSLVIVEQMARWWETHISFMSHHSWLRLSRYSRERQRAPITVAKLSVFVAFSKTSTSRHRAL
jgi:alpha-L-rhamnosidase